jgi:hypothetical protein
VDLSNLCWIKVITDGDRSEWAYTRQHLKDINNVIDVNGVTVFPLGFRDASASKPEQKDLIALIQKGKLTHIVEVLDQNPYFEGDWFHRFIKVVWWLPDEDWQNLLPQSEFLGFDPTLMDGKPHLITELRRYRERWKVDGSFEEFLQHLTEKLNQLLAE